MAEVILKTIDIVHFYGRDLIEQEKYNDDEDYYEKMMLNSVVFYFMFWAWGVNKVFKPKYRKEMSVYKIVRKPKTAL